MSRADRTLERILSGAADHNLALVDLLSVLRRLGFAERRRGSHVILSHEGIPEILNLQPLTGGRAKPYQVKQVRRLLLRYGVAGASDE